MPPTSFDGALALKGVLELVSTVGSQKCLISSPTGSLPLRLPASVFLGHVEESVLAGCRTRTMRQMDYSTLSRMADSQSFCALLYIAISKLYQQMWVPKPGLSIF
jgi:hypothetical protein